MTFVLIVCGEGKPSVYYPGFIAYVAPSQSLQVSLLSKSQHDIAGPSSQPAVITHLPVR
jgi:hypothetical protein